MDEYKYIPIPWDYAYDIEDYIHKYNEQKPLLELFLITNPNSIYKFTIDKQTYINIYYKNNKFYIENDDIIYYSKNYEDIKTIFHSIYKFDFKLVEIEYELTVTDSTHINIQPTPYIDTNNINNMSDMFTKINVSNETENIEENNEFKTIILDKPNDVYDKIMDIMIVIAFICIFTLMIIMVFDLILNN